MNTALNFKDNLFITDKGLQLAYCDLNLYSEEFKEAITLYGKGLLNKSLHFFELAYESVNHSDVYHNKYASYCGVTRLLNGDTGGLELCRDAARSEIYDADVFLNLARAEWRFHNRKKTIIALEKGLQIDRKHPGILKMREGLGVRKRKPFLLFSRDHVINKYIGRFKRK